MQNNKIFVLARRSSNANTFFQQAESREVINNFISFAPRFTSHFSIIISKLHSFFFRCST